MTPKYIILHHIVWNGHGLNRWHLCPRRCLSVITALHLSLFLLMKDSGFSLHRFFDSKESCAFFFITIKFLILLSALTPLIWWTASSFNNFLPKCCSITYRCSYIYFPLVLILTYPLTSVIRPVLKLLLNLPVRDLQPHDFEQNFAVSLR